MPKKNPPNDLALRTARIEATLRHSELGDRERLVLHAYHHYEAMHGGACGKPGLCWPTDGELGAYLGRSDITTRRARRWLAGPPDGVPPFIAVTYVPPFHKLPNGQTSAHGANVITLLEITHAEPEAVPTPEVLELAEADQEVRALEAQLARARARVQQSAQRLAQTRASALRRRAGSHNAPSQMTPGWSLLTGGSEARGGEGAQLSLSLVA